MQSSAQVSETIVGISHETHGTGHHEEHPDHRIFGILMFLIAESMIFLGLFAAYLTFKLTSPDWQPEGTELELLLPGVNTLILISSSFVIHKAGDAIKNKGDEKGLRVWFAITALMGFIFLVGQLYEYFHLSFGLTDNVFASTFYVLTGFHGLHVLFGLVLILGVLWRSRISGHYSQTSHFGVEAAELYWHFVDVVWIVLFTLLYLL